MQEMLIDLRDLLLFTIPELLFVTMFTYLLLKQYGIFDRYLIKKSLTSILVPPVLASIVFYLVNLISDSQIFDIFSQIATLICLFVLIAYYINKNSINNKISVIKILGITFLSFILVLISEVVGLIMINSVCNINLIELIKNNDSSIFIKWITSFSWILLDGVLVVIMLIKKNIKIITMLNTIIKTKELFRIFVLILASIILFMFIYIKFILFEAIGNLSVTIQVLSALVVVIIIPSLLLILLNTVTTLRINDEYKMQQLYQSNDSDILESKEKELTQ